jgi:hypothetical protein
VNRCGIAVALLGWCAAGCATIHNRPLEPATPCRPDAALVGAWTDARMTPLGPAWLRVSFAANCQFTMRIQLLYVRFRESGRYSVKDGVVSFERHSGATTWPYRVDGVRLELRETADELYVYHR